jgi:rhamnosyltransferase
MHTGLGPPNRWEKNNTDASVAAIVVTFYPRPEHLRSLAKIRAQVDLLIVVDNGSHASELAQIRIATQDPGLRLIENGENLGIAAALNQGVRAAQQVGCRWVALFDQDSELTSIAKTEKSCR